MSNEKINILSDDSFQDFIKEGVALVDFYADWCGPCKMISPILEELATELGEKLRFGKIDIDQNTKAASEFQVTSIPTIVIYKNGQEVNRVVGLKDKDSLQEVVNSAL